MNQVKLFLIAVGFFLLCQSCATSSSPDSKFQGRARLLDLGNGICQQSNGLMWQVDTTEIFSSEQEALAYIQNLNLGHHKDWRLPTKDELYDLCFFFEVKLVGDCPIKPKGRYWSMNGKPHAGEWHVYSLCGGSELHYIKGTNGRVRAVRP